MEATEVVHARYRLERLLGRGGMAEVWRATDERLERPIAVKFLAERLTENPEFLVRFFSEAQTVARISDAHVVPVLDFGEHEGRPFLAMEFVGGGSLEDVTGEPMLPERAAEIVAQAALGAGAAHDLGLVHRDIKPANILLTEDGTAKLADFGISLSRQQEQLTATGTAVGSPHYVSPEQASGAPVGPPSDVYALGVVLYELLAGRRPFEAGNIAALAIAHVEREPEPPSAHVEDLDPSLVATVMACLAKDPGERPPDGTTLARALDGGPSAVPASAPAVPDVPVAEPDSRRFATRTIVTAVAAALVVATAAAGIMSLARRPAEVARAGPDGFERESDVADGPRARGAAPADGADAADLEADTTPTPTESSTPHRPSVGATDAGSGRARGGSVDNDDSDTDGAPQPTSEPSSEPTSEPEPTPEETSDEESS